jgi:hypothetical protein
VRLNGQATERNRAAASIIRGSSGDALWVNLQAQYDLAVVEREHGARYRPEVEVA